MATLLDWDQAFFELINRLWTNRLMDIVMPAFHPASLWLIILSPMALYIAWRYPGSTRRLIITAALVLLIVDQTNARLLKPLFGRLRPCQALDGVRLLVKCGGLYGLPSGHAASTAALALTFLPRYKRATAWLLLLVVMIGYSRVYVGVHYPLDVLAGWSWGSLAGLAGWTAFVRWDRRASNHPKAC